MIWKLIKILGIGRWTLEYSLIGNSILEIYVKSDSVESVKQELAKKEMNLLQDFDITAKPEHAQTEDFKHLLVKRIKFLYERARLVNMKKCILSGLSDDIVTAVTSKNDESRRASISHSDHSEGDRKEMDNMVIDSPKGDNHHA